ncbi:alpha/beta fold hydrolase [archaeon]|nr:alpha/beta fold hydrolase [archaeon]
METPVTFRNKNGLQLVGILHTPKIETSDKTIILCHGFGGNKTQKMFVDTARFLCDNNFYVLRFDFTGHGDSEGIYTDYSIKNEVDDLDCAVEFLKTQNINIDNIGLVGHSLGAVISVLYAKEHKNVSSLVLLASALNQKKLLLLWYSKEQIYDLKLNGKVDIEKYTITKEFFDEVKDMDLTLDVSKLKIPALIIHGKKDDTVPVEYIMPLFISQTNTFNVEIFDEMDHDFKDLKSRKIIKERIADWFLK